MRFGKWGTLKAVSLLLSHRWQFWFWFQKFQVRRKPHHPRRKCCVLPCLRWESIWPIQSWAILILGLHCLEIPLFVFGVSLVLEDVMCLVCYGWQAQAQIRNIPYPVCQVLLRTYQFINIAKYHTDSYAISSNIMWRFNLKKSWNLKLNGFFQKKNTFHFRFKQKN